MFFPPIFWPTPKLPSHFPCTEHPDTGVKLGIKVLNAPCSSILRPSPGPGVGKQRRFIHALRSGVILQRKICWKLEARSFTFQTYKFSCFALHQFWSNWSTALVGIYCNPLTLFPVRNDQCCNQWILGLPANPPKPTQPSKNWMNGNLQKTPTLEAKTMVSCRCSLKPICWNPSCITFRRCIRSPLAFPRLVHHHSQRAALTLPPVALPKGSGAQEGSEALLLGGHQSLVDLLHLGR